MNLNLFSNLVNNFKFLQEDFLGISFSLSGIYAVFLNIFFSVILIATLYLFGNKVRSLLFAKYNGEFTHFINIGLGYIFLTTGIAILGILSLLYSNIIIAYFLLVLLIGIYPAYNLKLFVGKFRNLLGKIHFEYKSNSWIFIAIFLFVIIAFLRLIPPEIGEDAISHHTSLPSLYLRMHSTMVDPRLSSSIVIPVPQLGDLLYVITQSFGVKDASRYVHFAFYVIFLILIYCVGKKNKFNGAYSILLFITAPVVIQVSSRANVDFQWLICWLLSVILITGREKSNEKFAISALMFGGVLATKLWTIAFFPIFPIYLLFANKNKILALKKSIIFLLIALAIPLLWYIRSYILTGTPFYPVFSQVESNPLGSGFSSFIGFSKDIYNSEIILKFSPLVLLGLALFLFNKFNIFKKIINSEFGLFFILLGIETLFLRRYYFPRYLMGTYAIFVILISSGLREIIVKSNISRIIFVSIYIVTFLYYFLNTLFILPYGLGWAESNKYLTRILSRDYSSYYDFDYLFGKLISNKDLVATYNINGYYYANFKYIATSYIFDKENKSFDLLLENKVTKLLVRGGDIFWFCSILDLHDCNLNRVKFLARYRGTLDEYYLYDIRTF